VTWLTATCDVSQGGKRPGISQLKGLKLHIHRVSKKNWQKKLQPDRPCSIYLPHRDERLSWPRWLVVGYIPRWFTCRQTVTHPSTNRARRRVTSLIVDNNYYTTVPGVCVHPRNIFCVVADGDVISGIDNVLCLYRQMALPYSMFAEFHRRERKRLPADGEEVRQYAAFVGGKCARRMLLYRQ